MVVIGSHDFAKVRNKSMRYSEVGCKTLRPFVWVKWSGLAYQVDLGWLEAAEDDSTLIGQHAVGPVETQSVSIL